MYPRKRECELPVPQMNMNTKLELQRSHIQSQTRKKPVVCLRDGFKRYGSTVILDGFNLTIPTGIIYGLLGSSGCGKTTILNCILGHKKLDSGEIRIFGEDPISNNISKRRFGYMPQDTSLYGDFTLREILLYFGWILEMSTEEIREQSEILIKFLMLPDTNQRIKSFSGGEQRRVSLAATLLHEPELLILDEPTVGLDPILRETVWNYLLSICKDNNTTIILTTHYIEEVRQAHTVGLMRRGKLLAEECPQNLLKKYSTETLEEVFLVLSISQNNKPEQVEGSSLATTAIDKISPCAGGTSASSFGNAEEKLVLPNRTHGVRKDLCLLDLKGNRLKALLWKNALWWRRNYRMLVMEIILFIMMVVFCCLGVGLPPNDVSVAVVNYETNNTNICNTLTCHGTHISCNYLKYFEDNSTKLVYYSSEENSEEAVLHGKVHASIVIPANYTAALRSRISSWRYANPWNVQYSTFKVFLDRSDKFVTAHLQHRFILAYKRFFADYLQSCDLIPTAIGLPVTLETPVYGQLNNAFTDTLFPGIVIGFIFQLAVALTCNIMLLDRNEVSLERTLSMGITRTELIVAHILCECLISTAQSILGVSTALFVFCITNNGSILLVFILAALVGFAGICYGIFISCVCDGVVMATLMAIGTFFPIITLSGIIWPLEAVHYLLKDIAMVLPVTRSIISMRSILQKGWGLFSQDVYEGFVVIIIWTAIFLLLTAAAVKFKKS